MLEFTQVLSSGMIKNDKKILRGWSMFDWANSVYSLVISTAVFPPYFSSVAPDTIKFLGTEIESEASYSFSISLSFLIIAIMTPILSGIADHSGRRLKFMKVFTLIGSLGCMGLFFFSGPDTAKLALIFFMIGTIGYGGSRVFYNSFLPVIASSDRFDKVSAQGYAYGYIGSVILLLIILAMIQFSGQLGFASDASAIRIGFVLVGIWWFGFAYLTYRVLPTDNKTPYSSQFMSDGFSEIRKVYRVIRKDSEIVKFLGSYFFFIAGVNVVIYLAAVFAEKELGFGQSQLIMLILLLQFVAMVGAYFFAYLSRIKGNKFSLMVQIIIWIVICIVAYYVHSANNFYFLAIFVGLVFGGIQSLARATYSKMIPADDSSLASFFSFYDVLTYLAIMSGTFVFGLVGQLTGNLRYSILATGVFFVISLIILASSKMDKDERFAI